MRHNIKATGVTLNDALREDIEKKLAYLERFLDTEDTSIFAQVEVGRTTAGQRSGNIYRAEINLHMAGKDLRSEAEREDIFSAIDEAKEEIVRAIEKEKTVRRSRFRRGASAAKASMRRLFRRK